MFVITFDSESIRNDLHDIPFKFMKELFFEFINKFSDIIDDIVVPAWPIPIRSVFIILLFYNFFLFINLYFKKII